jgi:hypothetical protein
MKDRDAPGSAGVLSYLRVEPAKRDAARNLDAVEAVVSGAAAILLCWIPLVVAIPIYAAIRCGIDGRRTAATRRDYFFATAGFVMGCVAIGLSGVLHVTFGVLMFSFRN